MAVHKDDNQSGVPNVDAFIYARSKLDAAAVLSAVYRNDINPCHNLGFMGTAYTAAHEAVELLLKLYLRRGPVNLPFDKTFGHDLRKLFRRWGTVGRNQAETAYQRDVLKDLDQNRISELVRKEILNLGPNDECPPDYWARKKEYEETYHKYRFQLLYENAPTVREVIKSLDAKLGARNIIRICSTHADGIRGFSCGPETWYPEKLLSLTWKEFEKNTQQGKSMGLIESFLKKEGTTAVFEGWRYLSEQKLAKQGVVFHGPPAKMVLIGRSLEPVVWHNLKESSSVRRDRSCLILALRWLFKRGG